LQGAVTPWLETPYQKQLQQKTEELKKVLKSIASEILQPRSHPVSFVLHAWTSVTSAIPLLIRFLIIPFPSICMKRGSGLLGTWSNMVA